MLSALVTAGPAGQGRKETTHNSISVVRGVGDERVRERREEASRRRGDREVETGRAVTGWGGVGIYAAGENGNVLFPEASPGSRTFRAGQKGKIRVEDTRRARAPTGPDSLLRLRACALRESSSSGAGGRSAGARNLILAVTQPFSIVDAWSKSFPSQQMVPMTEWSFSFHLKIAFHH